MKTVTVKHGSCPEILVFLLVLNSVNLWFLVYCKLHLQTPAFKFS